MNLTLKERERRAYITNAPDAALLADLADAESRQNEDLEAASKEIGELEAQIQSLDEAAEDMHERIETLEEKLADANQTLGYA